MANDDHRFVPERSTQEIIETLSPKERQALIERFGISLDGEVDRTNLMKALNVMLRERIAAIEEKALKKLGGSGVYDDTD